MKKRAGERLFEQLSQLPDEMIVEAEVCLPKPEAGGGQDAEVAADAQDRRHYKKSVSKILKYLPVAACLCLVLCVASYAGGRLFRAGNAEKSAADAALGSNTDSASIQESAEDAGTEEDAAATDGGSSAGAQEDARLPVRYDAYMGPVLAMTATGDIQKLSTSRSILCSAATDTAGDAGQPVLTVTDSYRIRNTSNEDKTVQLVYPIAAALNGGDVVSDGFLTVDGVRADADYSAGSGVADFLGRDARAQTDAADYKALLTVRDTDYQNQALAKEADWSREVTVYTFSDFVLESDDATPVVGITVKGNDEGILTYGFDYSKQTQEGVTCHSFFANAQTGTPMLIATERLQDELQLGYYTNLDCNEELAGVSCTMKKVQMTFAQALRYCAGVRYRELTQAYGDGSVTGSLPPYLTEDMLYQVLTQTGGEDDFCRALKERFHTPDLREAFSQLLAQTRIVYALTTVTIPAKRAVLVAAKLTKRMPDGYFELYGAAQETSAFDFLARAGSGLNIRRVTFALKTAGGWQPVENNMRLRKKSGAWRSVLHKDSYMIVLNQVHPR